MDGRRALEAQLTFSQGPRVALHTEGLPPPANGAVMASARMAVMTSAPSVVQVCGEAEAFAAIALAAVACDGELSAVEARRLRQQLETRRAFSARGDGAMAALLDRLLTILREQGCEALVQQAVPQLAVDLRETALAVAADLTATDHVQTGSEQRFLADLARQLQIAPQRSAVILEVIGLLNSDRPAD